MRRQDDMRRTALLPIAAVSLLLALTALAARQTLADRLYSRGADEAQVGLLLGIADRSAVRERFPRRQPTLEELTKDLI